MVGPAEPLVADYAAGPRAEPLGQRTARGAIWNLLQTVGGKIVSTLGQLVLAWILAPDQFGLVGLALTIFGFATVVQQIGLNEILVQRGRQFDRWANAAFWMSLSAGLVAALIMVAVAPAAERMFHAPGLVGVILVLALACPITALATVPIARLQHDLRFGTLAWLNFWTAGAQVALSVLLARLHFGVYSLVLPRVFVNLAQLPVLWRDQPSVIRLGLQLRRWRFLLSDSSYVFLSWIFFTLVAQGDYMSLGFWNSTVVVGIYYFGFALSGQINTLFTQSIWKVLLPALSRIQENPSHQLVSYLRAARMLAMVSTPAGFLLAALAAPGIRLVFSSKWHEAIPVVEALSIGMTVSVVGTTGHILLQAQGRFRTLLYLSFAMSMVFAALVVPAAAYGGRTRLGAATCVAIAVGLYHLLHGPINLYGGIRPLGGRWRDVGRVYLPVLSAGIVAVAIGALAGTGTGRAVSPTRIRDGVVIAVTSAVALAVYLPLVRLAAPDVWRELIDRASVLLTRGGVKVA
jgi:PST family polysaccharide transporter